MFSFDEAKSKISELVDDFDRKIDIIKKGSTHKEANIEDEYIKPLSRYLNWNISNEGIKNIADREFIVQANYHLIYDILGLTNSKTLSKYLSKISTPFRGGFWSCYRQYPEQLPIYLPNPQEKKCAMCQKIEEMIKQILAFRRDENHARDTEFFERKIDELVDKLYNVI